MRKTKDRISNLLVRVGFSGRGLADADERSLPGDAEKEPVRPYNSRTTGSKHQKEGLLEKLQRHMVAAAYAEAGELATAQEVVSAPTSSKTVLLVVEGAVPDQPTFNYAVNLCKRTNARLDILQVLEKSGPRDHWSDLSRSFADGAAHVMHLRRKLDDSNVPFQVTVKRGDVREKLSRYAKRHQNVSTVIIDSAKARTESDQDGTWARVLESIAHQLSIPLVTVVSKNAVTATT